MAPTRKRRRLCSELALKTSLESGLYPEFLGAEGPAENHDPESNSALDYLLLLWPESLTSHIATETNRYARQRNRVNWVDVTVEEIWTFFGILVLMGIHRLPRVRNYWSTDRLLGLEPIQQSMSLNRFWAIWSNLHVVDNDTIPPGGVGPSRKIKPIVDVLNQTFLKQYSPGQELAIDESMVKYKGHCKGKVRMPKKPIKLGYKVWCCSCSCCGYLCTFQFYDGRPVDIATGEKLPEKGLVKRVVTDLLLPFVGTNHVVYCDNFYTSGPLVDMLAKDEIFIVGSIQRRAAGFPDSLRTVAPPKGSYVSESVDGKQYFVFNDRKLVSFVTNVFPETMNSKVFRLQPEGVLREQSVPPLLPAYNKYMGAVDLTDQLMRTYGFDRKSKRCWLRPFLFCFDVSTNNAHILYKHNCKRCGVKPKDLLGFRLDLARLLLQFGSSSKAQSSVNKGKAQDVSVCCLSRVSDIGLKRGRCHQCIKMKRKRHTSFGCSVCKIRLCKIRCFQEYHNM